MKEYFVDLTDGTRLEVKVNFGTIYYLQKQKKFNIISKKARRSPKKMTDQDCMELAANMIYAILRSNGKAVTFDEALALMPPDENCIREVVEGFQAEYDEYIKKKRAKTMTMPG